MTSKQTLGWIGASVAAGIFPTLHMSFAAETLAVNGDVAGEHKPASDPGVWNALPNESGIDDSVPRPIAG